MSVIERGGGSMMCPKCGRREPPPINYDYENGVIDGAIAEREAVLEFALIVQERINSDNVIVQEYCEFACRIIATFALAIERGEHLEAKS